MNLSKVLVSSGKFGRSGLVLGNAFWSPAQGSAPAIFDPSTDREVTVKKNPVLPLKFTLCY
jgi:hypothetical protein